MRKDLLGKGLFSFGIVFAVLAVIILAGCGGGGNNNQPPPPTTYTLTVSRTGTGSGTVTDNAGKISCGSNCSATYDSGTSVTLTAAPATGSLFMGWSGDCTGTATTCTLSMVQNHSVTAKFDLLVVNVTPATASVMAGGTQQFVPKDQSGNVLDVNWYVDDVQSGNSTVGDIGAFGLYTAPAQVPNPATVTIKAVNRADSSESGTASVTITAPPPPKPFLVYWRNGPSTACGGLCEDIWKVHLDQNGLATDSPVQLTTDGGSLMPSVSPDGKSIAFISYRTSNNTIFLMNSDGSNQTQIPNGISWALWPIWSPNGKNIAFVGKATDDTVGIMRMNPDGTDIVQLTKDASCPSGGSCKIPGRPAWSPDGKSIAYGKSDGTTVIINSADGSNPFTLPTPNPSDFLSWSPNGTWISFSTFQSGNFTLCLIHPDGSGLANLAPAGLNPTWPPDSSRIIFQNGVDGKIYVIKIDGSGLTLVVGDSISTSGEPSWWGPH